MCVVASFTLEGLSIVLNQCHSIVGIEEINKMVFFTTLLYITTI